ncbi:MAG: MlaE family ABC transporter permease [Burkholderiales bacterium]
MLETVPRFEQLPTAEGTNLRVLGQWTAARFAQRHLFEGLVGRLEAIGSPAGWDLSQAEQIDHVGAQLLWDHWGRQWPIKLALLPAQRAVFERVALHTAAAVSKKKANKPRLYIALGGRVLLWVDHLQAALRLIGQLGLDLLRLVRAPQQGPWRDFSGHLYRIGATALPITALVGFLIGVVLAYLMAQQLRQFGADIYIVNILGVSLIRELGPLLAAILIAGRSGSAITAQIGVMRVTDELDAMRVMGIAHSFRLVLPRALALALAMPLISAWTTACALAGGMLAADVSLGIAPTFFLRALPNAVHLGTLVLASSKSAVFGLLIALIACHYGLRIKPNTQSLGEGTTASVVTSITVVILVDALFAVVFKNVGN